MLSWLQMFNTAGESTTVAQMNKGTTTTVDSYRPPYDGTLLKIVVFIGGEAATSLVEDVRVELECSKWKPNRQHFNATGSGLRTAPAFQLYPFAYDVELPVEEQTDIRGDYIHDSGVPVTSRIRVQGLFKF